MNQTPRGFALRELIVIAVLLVVVVVLLLLLLPGLWRSGDTIQDARQVREVHKALYMWAQPNNGLYPHPSALDRDNATVRVEGDATLKDSTGAVYSVLIFNELLTPKLVVSPAWVEEADHIVPYRAYEHENPSRSQDPAKARWDPGLRGTPLDDTPGLSERESKISHTSYAHLAIAGEGRLGEWKQTLNADYPVLGNRGPEETGAAWDPDTGEISYTDPANGSTGYESVTLLIHGAYNSWEGNIAYNDNHVMFETSTYPTGLFYTVGEGETARRFGDGLFLDEGDASVLDGWTLEDTGDGNTCLGLFSRGPTEAERREHEQAVKFIKQARWFDGMKE